MEQQPKLSGSPDFDQPSDQIVIRKAMKEEWPVTPEMRAKVLGQAINVVDNPVAAPEHRLTAGRTIMMADQINLKSKELKIKSQPKVHIHGHLTPEQVIARIKEITGVEGVDDPKAMVAHYLKHKQIVSEQVVNDQ